MGRTAVDATPGPKEIIDLGAYTVDLAQLSSRRDFDGCCAQFGGAQEGFGNQVELPALCLAKVVPGRGDVGLAQVASPVGALPGRQPHVGPVWIGLLMDQLGGRAAGHRAEHPVQDQPSSKNNAVIRGIPSHPGNEAIAGAGSVRREIAHKRLMNQRFVEEFVIIAG